MALPQIQQARIIQAPDVFNYAMREGPNIAQAFTAGLNAGTRMKEVKNLEKNREADKLDREKAKKQSFEMEFGQDIVTNPQTGEVDIPASREAQARRKSEEQFAEWAGSAEAGGKQAAGVDDAIRQSPAYKRGQVRGMMDIQKEMDALNRITKREEEARKRQEAIEAQRRRGMMIREGIKQAGGVLKGVFGGGTRRSSGSGDPSSDTSVRYTDPDNGAVYTFKSQEAYDKWRGKAPEEKDTGPDPDYTKAARDAIKQFDALQARGVPAKLEIDNAGIPKVTPKSGWDFFSTEATPETIDALRRKVNPRGQPSGRAPSSTGRSPVPVGDVMKGLPQSQPASGSPPSGTSTSIDELMGMWPASQGSVGDLYSRRPASAGSEIPRDPPEAELWRLLGQSGLMFPPAASRPSMTPEELLARDLRDQGLLPPLVSRVNLGPMSEQERARTKTRGQLTPEQEAIVERLVRAREPYAGLPPDREKTMAELLGLDLKPRNK